jgi:deoxyadenosine/deoxycytidine kinase
MTLIVVEGIDGSGKSTLIADLAHQLPDGVHIKRRGPLQRHPLEEYEYDLTDYTPRVGEHWLLDRWHIGEQLYGPLYRGQSQVTSAMRMHIDLVLDKLGALKILMAPPEQVIQERIAKRGEDFLQPQHFQVVYDAYKEQCTALDGWVSLTSPTKLNLDAIIDAAERLEVEAEEIEQFQTYIGPRFPKLLLLGDKRGNAVHGRPRYPWAFVPYRDTSGHFLFTALGMVDLTDFGVANAVEEDVERLWESLGTPKVCVMGTEAWDTLLRRYPGSPLLDAVTKRVVHPQHQRRFNNGKCREYGESIKEALRG